MSKSGGRRKSSGHAMKGSRQPLERRYGNVDRSGVTFCSGPAEGHGLHSYYTQEAPDKDQLELEV